MSLKQRIQDDIKAAMRARDAQRLGAIRLLHAGIRQKEIDERIELDDPQVLAIVERLIKQRRDSIAQYQAAARDDLVAGEQFELDVLSEYRPEQASAEEVARVIAAAVAEVGQTGPAAMGAVMARVKAALTGRADLGAISGQVRSALMTK